MFSKPENCEGRQKKTFSEEIVTAVFWERGWSYYLKVWVFLQYVQCDRSSTNTEVDDPIPQTVMWKSWWSKLWLIIQYAVNEDLTSMADVLYCWG